jgi:hypothetical protein
MDPISKSIRRNQQKNAKRLRSDIISRNAPSPTQADAKGR